MFLTQVYVLRFQRIQASLIKSLASRASRVCFSYKLSSEISHIRKLAFRYGVAKTIG